MLQNSYTNTDIYKCFLKLVIRQGSHVLEEFNLLQVLSHEGDTPT